MRFQVVKITSEQNKRGPGAQVRWHPTAIQHRPWGATDLSLLRSVLDLANYSVLERDQV